MLTEKEIARRKKLSEKQKLAHAEGRHPGWAHKNKDPNRASYPERWFRVAMGNDEFLRTCRVVEQLSLLEVLPRLCVYRLHAGL